MFEVQTVAARDLRTLRPVGHGLSLGIVAPVLLFALIASLVFPRNAKTPSLVEHDPLSRTSEEVDASIDPYNVNSGLTKGNLKRLVKLEYQRNDEEWK